MFLEFNSKSKRDISNSSDYYYDKIYSRSTLEKVLMYLFNILEF